MGCINKLPNVRRRTGGNLLPQRRTRKDHPRDHRGGARDQKLRGEGSGPLDQPHQRSHHGETSSPPEALQVPAQHAHHAAEGRQRRRLPVQHLGYRTRLLLHRHLAQGNPQQGRKEQKHHPVHGLRLRHDGPQQQLPHQVRTLTPHPPLYISTPRYNQKLGDAEIPIFSFTFRSFIPFSPPPPPPHPACISAYSNITSDFMQIAMLVALVALGSCTMRIQSPSKLADFFGSKYPGGEIPYSIANYGVVPYGKTLSGEVGVPSVLEDCVFEELPAGQSKSILLVERNDCSFTQKSINVQLQGGKLAIIMDNRSENPDRIVMIDDGRGGQVKIPTVLISLEDGQHILDSIRSGSVIVSILFSVEKRQKADLQIWVDIAEHQNFIFLRKLNSFYNKIKKHINFSVAYPTRSCSARCLESDCFYNQTYCRADLKFWGVEGKGQLLIREQLRQYYIHRLSADRWWDYVLAYDQFCEDLAVVEECSAKIMKKNGIDPKQIKKMVDDSFGPEDNALLREMSETKENSSILFFPSVVVNSMVYRGNLEPFEVYELICESLEDTPEGCQGFEGSSSTLSTWIIFIVALVVVFGVFLVVCFRRIARRQVSEKINSQVNELVNQYITMYENQRFNQGTELQKKEPAQA